MFIISFKFNKQKFFMGLIIVLIVAAILGVGYFFVSNKRIERPVIEPKTVVEQINNNDIVSYIQSFGWKVELKPVEVEKFKIPEEFDTIYKRYNQYQRDIGKDLTPFKGKEVTRYTYKVLNYNNLPQYQGQQVYADAIVYDGQIIAGDLKTNQLNGFMVSLKDRTFKEITGIDEQMFR